MLGEASALSMFDDVLVDLQSERQSGPTGEASDAWRGAVSHGVEEVFQLQAKRLAFGDVCLGEGEAGGGV